MTVIGILLIVMAVFLVIAVLMQSSKDHRHGGVVAGGAETFFGKQKGKSMDALFNKLTTVVAIIFVVLVVVLYVLQPSFITLTISSNENPNVEDVVIKKFDIAEGMTAGDLMAKINVENSEVELVGISTEAISEQVFAPEQLVTFTEDTTLYAIWSTPFVEEQTEENAEEQTEEQVEEQVEEQTEEQVEEQTEENSEVNVENGAVENADIQ